MNREQLAAKLDKLSIQSQRSGAYLSVALALVSIIPMLALGLIFVSFSDDLLPDSIAMRAGLGSAGFLGVLAGYLMLRVYPHNLDRLRHYLERIARDDLPEHAELMPGEQDLSDIELYLNQVIGSLRTKVTRLDEDLHRSRQMLDTIEAQSREIMEAERQRVMIESLGAACHHIGQPMTVLSLYLSRMEAIQKDNVDEDVKACLNAVKTISSILKKLRQVSEYRTVPYACYHYSDDAGQDERLRILDIEPESA